MRHAITIVATLLLALGLHAQGGEELCALLDRVGGSGAGELITLEVDETLGSEGTETFAIMQREGKPLIVGSTTSATTAGLGWYLNHYAHVNISWSQPRVELSSVSLPLPQKEERHTASAALRYYLNYCTFSYSMAFWTWERWEQELDWMALHGVNMALALVGADVVWRDALTELGCTEEEIGGFIAGPGFQAWWLMNNLTGWGGPNPKWWYESRRDLATRILTRMRQLGMEPVLPGYNGMMPRDAGMRLGWQISDPGTWCGFSRPAFLTPGGKGFDGMAEIYYRHLTETMGTARYYSIDPFHEGGQTDGIDLPRAYAAIEDAMLRCNPEATWVVQSWNENPRPECLETVEKGRLLVLDLFSDGQPKWRRGYGGHDFIYCMLHNFGGRTGLHGRLAKTMAGYYEALDLMPEQLQGIGATPEGIETNPILYDALYELPWRKECNLDEWLTEYVESRYSTVTAPKEALEAWRMIAGSALDCPTSQQGTSEPVMCARPALRVESVSTWSTSRIYYQPDSIVEAAWRLLSLSDTLQGENYDYDLCDVVRQAISDRANLTLRETGKAYEEGNRALYEAKRDTFLQLILDQDRLLSTCPYFTLGRWTQMAREAAREAGGKKGGEDWMEWQARTLVTVWGDATAATTLHDYSNREWSGLLRDFHYPRWERFFHALDAGVSITEWYEIEAIWTVNLDKQYYATPTECTADVARELMEKHFSSVATREY